MDLDDNEANMSSKHADSFRSRMLTELFLLAFTRSNRNMKGVFMIATTESEDSLHSRLSTAHMFMEKKKLSAPSRQARRDVRYYASQDLNHD